MVHSNKNLHDTDKFNYLWQQLQGPADKLLYGLELTKYNYKIAVDRLKERYEKKHVMTDTHYAKLMSLPVQPTSLRVYQIILRHHWEIFTLFTLAWRRWQPNADLVDVEIKTTKQCVTWVREDEAWKWRVDCKKLQKNPEKTRRSSRSLQHSDEAVSQARWITKGFHCSCNSLLNSLETVYCWMMDSNLDSKRNAFSVETEIV